MAAVRVARLYQRCWSCLSNSTKYIATGTKHSYRSLCSAVTQTTEDSRSVESRVAEEVPTRRKEFRKFRSRIYRQNRRDPVFECRARRGNLVINLEDVHKVWLAKEGFKHIHKLAKHYGIFEHIFGSMEFIPTKMMGIDYGQNDHHVHWGNFITPSQASSTPNVNFDSDPNLYWSLIVTNPDGNIWEEDAQLLHWFVANIPGNDVSKGEEISKYLPPIPPKGTGFHRYVYCLLQQKDRLNLDHFISPNASFSSQHTFRMTELLTDHKDSFTPVGLSFFQAAWDETVTKTYNEALGISEPIYDVKTFVTPTSRRKNTTRDTFDHKYRNM